MSFEFRCPHCAKRYQVSEKHSGKKISCRQCEKAIEVPFPPLELPEEVSEGGSTIYRHEARMRDLEIATGDDQNIELIDEHITKHLGPVESVLHEIISDLVHIDVHWVPPTEDRPWHSLVTSGMSDRPMHAPPQFAELSYAELMVCLPPEWDLSQEAFEDYSNYWPIEWLKRLARFPHEYETWLFEGHTLPNGDPAEPFCDGVGFSGWLLYWSVTAPENFHTLKVDNDKTIHFFSIYPIYQKEMDLKLTKGTDALIERFQKHSVTDILDVNRKDSTKKRGWFS